MEGEGKEPDEEVGTLFLSRSCLALIWHGGGCNEKWGVLVKEVGMEGRELVSLCRRK